MNATFRILLLFLLFISQGRSMCSDQAGNIYFCGPQLFSQDDDHRTPCHCPCSDDDCEEHELKLDPVLGDPVKIPSQPCVILPFEYAVHFGLDNTLFLWSQSSEPITAIVDPDCGYNLRKSLMAGVVLRL